LFVVHYLYFFFCPPALPLVLCLGIRFQFTIGQVSERRGGVGRGWGRGETPDTPPGDHEHMPLDLGVLIRVLDEHSKEMKEVRQRHFVILYN
jgi:hypothetical protein